MRKILLLVVIGILVLSGLGSVALKCDMKTSNSKCDVVQSTNSVERGYTHTVFVEVGRTSTCSSCPQSNSLWHTIYDSGNYDFEYCEMVVNKNSVADSHMNDRNLYWVPTSYWDGGEYVYPGTNTNTFYNYLDASGARVVPDLVADLNVDWLGNAQLEISFTIKNNEAVAYPGRLRVYVTELESELWNDQQGKPFYHAFLDFAINKAINIPAGNTYSDTIVWDGVAEGYPRISGDNIQVILVVFDDTAHTSFSDPPDGAPFLAYYVDETVAARDEEINNPPYNPNNPNPANHATDVDVDADLGWESGDPDEGGTVTYDIYFGDVNPPPLEKSGHPDTSYNPGTMELFTTYYWYIIARDNHGDSSVGPFWDFTTAGEDPNQPPNKPDKPSGETNGKAGDTYPYTTNTTDLDGDVVKYGWDLDGDGSVDKWDDNGGSYYLSGVQISTSLTWSSQGTYSLKVMAEDINGAQSEWSDPLSVTMPRNRATLSFQFLNNLLENHPLIYQLLLRFLRL